MEQVLLKVQNTLHVVSVMAQEEQDMFKIPFLELLFVRGLVKLAMQLGELLKKNVLLV